MKWLEGYVTTLAEASCKAVRDAVWEHGDHQKWTASYDGFYLTRGTTPTIHQRHSMIMSQGKSHGLPIEQNGERITIGKGLQLEQKATCSMKY